VAWREKKPGGRGMEEVRDGVVWWLTSVPYEALLEWWCLA
jgi:hypothetical protein